MQFSCLTPLSPILGFIHSIPEYRSGDRQTIAFFKRKVLKTAEINGMGTTTAIHLARNHELQKMKF
jgi:hypothetical protein